MVNFVDNFENLLIKKMYQCNTNDKLSTGEVLL